jgi:hypothetical protein
MDHKLDDAARRKLFASVLSTDDFEPASALVRADFAARSHRGRAFKDNEDHYLALRLGRSEETLDTSLINLDVPHRFDESSAITLHSVPVRKEKRHGESTNRHFHDAIAHR